MKGSPITEVVVLQRKIDEAALVRKMVLPGDLN